MGIRFIPKNLKLHIFELKLNNLNQAFCGKIIVVVTSSSFQQQHFFRFFLVYGFQEYPTNIDTCYYLKQIKTSSLALGKYLAQQSDFSFCNEILSDFFIYFNELIGINVSNLAKTKNALDFFKTQIIIPIKEGINNDSVFEKFLEYLKTKLNKPDFLEALKPNPEPDKPESSPSKP